MFSAEDKPAVPASERPQTHALDRAATGIATFLVPGKRVCIFITFIYTFQICNYLFDLTVPVVYQQK
jgi:hypothetical protein